MNVNVGLVVLLKNTLYLFFFLKSVKLRNMESDWNSKSNDVLRIKKFK